MSVAPVRIPTPYAAPPRTHGEDGHIRRVGFEVEFGGLTLAHGARLVAEALGAEMRAESAASWRLEVEGLAAFRVELDWRYLKERAAAAEADEGERPWVDVLQTAAELVVPAELVGPPLPLDAIDRMDPALAALRGAGATGTRDSLLAAYGVHVNAEAPTLDVRTLRSYVRAFALLQDWLVAAHDVDLTRRVTPYVDPWPPAYVETVLERSEATVDHLFVDYLAHNATRNRALDLLPLLATLDEDRVRAAVPDLRIQARPAFHYRLPDCRIEDPDWSLAHPWNLWMTVENLASRPDDVDALARRRLALGGGARRAWIRTVDRWLRDRGWA